MPQTITRDGLEYPYIRLKNYEGPFQDEKVRQALAYAVNVPAYIENIYGGNATQAQCQTNGPAVFGFNPDLEPYPYDPEKAKQLLEEAGYNGEPARIIAPTGRWLKFEELAEAIQADMDAVGLNATIEMMQFDPWLTEFIQHIGEGQPEGALSSTSNELLDSDRMSSLVGESGSVSSFDSPELEAQLAAARTELDVEVREQMYHDISKDICDQAANIPLLTFQDIYGAAENLQWTPRIDGTARVDEMTLTTDPTQRSTQRARTQRRVLARCMSGARRHDMTYPWEGAIPADDLERFRAGGYGNQVRPIEARAPA